MKLNSAIALALASAAALAATSASAATLSATATNYSKQGVAALTASTPRTLPNITSVLSSDLVTNDTIKVTISGVTLSAGLNPTMVCAAGFDTQLAVGFVSQTGNDLLFRVTNRTGGVGTTTIGDTCTISGITTTAGSLASATTVTATTVTNSGVNPALVLDTQCATADTGAANGAPAACGAGVTANQTVVARVVSQFAARVATGSGFNSIVDVSAGRKTFASPYAAGDNNLTDASSIDLVNDGALADAVTVSQIRYSVNGDFSHVDITSATAGCGDETAATFAAGSTVGGVTLVPTVTSNCQTFRFTTGAAPGTLGAAATSGNATYVTFPVSLLQTATTASQKALASPQTFAGAVEFTYGTTVESVAVTPGGWSVNGAVANIPYMPYGSGISTIVYVANRNSVAGRVLLTAYNEGGTIVVQDALLGTVNARSVLQLSGAINAALGNPTSGRYSFVITVEAPSSGIEVYSAYRNGLDYGTVVNSLNGK